MEGLALYEKEVEKIKHHVHIRNQHAHAFPVVAGRALEQARSHFSNAEAYNKKYDLGRNDHEGLVDLAKDEWDGDKL